MLICRYVQTGLRHQCQQAHGFQRYRFTPCVGACNYYHEKFVSEVKVDRHDISRQQWMASVAQVNKSRIVQVWFSTAHQAPVARLGKMQVKLGEQFNSEIQRVYFAANLQ